MDCCKNYAVIKKGKNLYCENDHPYVAENTTVLPATKRLDVLCDMCQAYVDIFYNDSLCNLAICPKCCVQFTVSKST